MPTGLLHCVTEYWRPVIGDPGWQGWSTVLLYLLTSILAFRVTLLAPFPTASRGRERLFWLLIAVLMAALAVNKQLDLQSALTALGRCLARAQGWYNDRRYVQLAFLIVLAGMALVFLLAMLALMRHSLRRSAVPALGLAFTCGFVLMRAVGFHHFDRILGMPVVGLRANTALEWTGPLLIMGSALWLGRGNRR
ncbi:isopropylmalate isomerase [Paracoccus caeni]|uniref:Isopropylmalate isomerase n=1 Tax=Paracoccus caeni TaxID=657651 RepID=A0A934W0I1_9RHOB|nr:isopropylmalate isomerase [Paracoccus caeni]MBK4218117.1 isopropylmalate isomerase [Paracoccus caeni]